MAPVHLSALHAFIAILAIAAGAGAAGALNMWYDADIDKVMARTATRPIPRGAISQGDALAFGLRLACVAVAVLAVVANDVAAALLAFTIFFYVAVYTMWLKRCTPQNIVIGGAAGALPPVIGWAAAAGGVGLEPLVLFLIIFVWTPPHFWALSLNRANEYARAGVPMLPVVAGRAGTTRQILLYSLGLVPISELPWVFGFAGKAYGAVALIFGAIFVALAVALRHSAETDRRSPQRLFVFSIAYLFVLFASLLIGNNDAQSPASRPLNLPAAISVSSKAISHLTTGARRRSSVATEEA
jgi:protoheme IX farnesyltransferase